MNDELTPPDSTPPGGASMHDIDPAPAHAARAGCPDTEPPPPRGAATAGGMIRDARQAQGIDLASLAAMLKIPLRRLEALENGRHDELQGSTFERALAQAACRVLKIDPKPVLALLPQQDNRTLESVTEGINTPFRDGHGGFEIPQLMRPWLLVALVFVAAAAALWLVPEGWFAHATRPLMDSLSSPAPASAPAAASASQAEQEVAAAARELAASDVAPEQVGASVPAPVASASAAQPGSTAAPTEAASGPEAQTVPATAAAATVQVIAVEDSWVEAIDAKGHTLLSRTVSAGELVGLDGPMPMHLKIGNAAGTQLRVRGEDVDLTRWNKDNVARLQVK